MPVHIYRRAALEKPAHRQDLRLAWAGGCLALMLSAGAWSQHSTDALQARYQADLQHCSTLADPETAATCRREAAAALQTARKNELNGTTDAQHQRNATQRCQRLPVEQRDDCLFLIQQGQAGAHMGSVSGGGVLRRTEIIIQGDPGD